jgi:uncharacterized protein YfaA (DUF2138 family)
VAQLLLIKYDNANLITWPKFVVSLVLRGQERQIIRHATADRQGDDQLERQTASANNQGQNPFYRLRLVNNLKLIFLSAYCNEL